MWQGHALSNRKEKTGPGEQVEEFNLPLSSPPKRGGLMVMVPVSSIVSTWLVSNGAAEIAPVLIALPTPFSTGAETKLVDLNGEWRGVDTDRY